MVDTPALADVPPAASDAFSDNRFRFATACEVRPFVPLRFTVEEADEQSRSLFTTVKT